ncbi:hypothetical protein JCM11251_003719, partial [Rhodosporidiobolus azoricus]
LSNVASPAVPSTPVNITRKSIASLHHSPSTASLSSFASTEPSALFDFGVEEDSFSSSFSDSSSVATDFSCCLGDDNLDLESGEAIFLNAFQVGIAGFFHSAAASAPNVHTRHASNSSPSPALLCNTAAPSPMPAPTTHRKLASFDSPSVLLRAAAWEHRAAENLSSLRARPQWRY